MNCIVCFDVFLVHNLVLFKNGCFLFQGFFPLEMPFGLYFVDFAKKVDCLNGIAAGKSTKDIVDILDKNSFSSISVQSICWLYFVIVISFGVSFGVVYGM